MFKLLIALSTLCAIASAGYISGYGLGGHGVSYGVPAYQSASYVAAAPIVRSYSAPVVRSYSAPIVRSYSAPIVSAPVVKTITPLSAHTVRSYKVVETAPAYVHSVPSVYADHGYGIHYGKKR